MDLFSKTISKRKDDQSIPLAERVRPQKLIEVVGQDEITGSDSWLAASLNQGQLSPVIFWGPPGVGKTTIAKVIAVEFEADFISLSAVSTGVKEIREIIKKAQYRKNNSQQTVLFIDEIHRFNKGQQDALLHAVEDGTLVLIGATTENPSFEVNAPLLSRCQVIQLKPLDHESLRRLLKRAMSVDHFLKKMKIKIEDEDFLFRLSGGDGRQLLNMVERSLPLSYSGQQNYTISSESLQKVAMKQVPYDKSGDNHYDTISAFIKSVRGSDPDAALFWLARMLVAGEDPLFIARRLVILASEDIGNAEPYALSLATAGFQAVSMIGMPESRIILGQVTSYLASLPKSNASYKAIDMAMQVAEKNPLITVPLHLRNAPTKLMKDLEFGKDYLYPHSYPMHFIDQEYFPPEVEGVQFYKPTDQGREAQLAKYLQLIRKMENNDD